MIDFITQTFTTPSMERVQPRNVAASLLANHFAGTLLWVMFSPIMFYSGVSLLFSAILISIVWVCVIEVPQYLRHKPPADIIFDAGSFVCGVFFALSLWKNNPGDAVTTALLTFVIAQSAFKIKKKEEIDNG